MQAANISKSGAQTTVIVRSVAAELAEAALMICNNGRLLQDEDQATQRLFNLVTDMREFIQSLAGRSALASAQTSLR